MPKHKKKFNTNEAPPIDWLWGAVLERIRVYGMSLEDLARIAGVEYGNMRQMINRSPWDWKKVYRDRVCSYFGISIYVSPNVDGRIEVNIK